MDFIGGLLDSDVRNNSAWNQRWFVLVKEEGAGSDSTLISDDVVRKELQYCFSNLIL